jgi:hypothetical protein
MFNFYKKNNIWYFVVILFLVLFNSVSANDIQFNCEDDTKCIQANEIINELNQKYS